MELFIIGRFTSEEVKPQTTLLGYFFYRFEYVAKPSQKTCQWKCKECIYVCGTEADQVSDLSIVSGLTLKEKCVSDMRERERERERERDA